MEKKRIKIFVGEFGSGKTELAVNYALLLRSQGYKTAIVDVDLVKPYFRARENRILLENKDVQVVAAGGGLEHADLPIMPHELPRVLYDESCQVIMDVGGGKGAIVLGQLRNKLLETTYDSFLVVNTRRPFTDSVEGILQTLRSIEETSRLPVTGLISDTNLGEETTPELILEGLSLLEEVAKQTQLPIHWVVVPDWLAGKVSVPYPEFQVTRYTHYPWMD